MKASRHSRRRIGRLVLLSAGVLVPRADVAAQVCTPGIINLAVDGKTLELDRTAVTRIPYGRDMTAWIAPPEGVGAREVVAEYRVASDERGVRTDAITAQLDPSRGCWAAGLRPLHLNESGTLTATLYLEPRYREDHTAATLVADLLARLDTIEGGEREVFAGDPEQVFIVEGEALEAVPLGERLASLAVSEIEVTAALTSVGSDAQAVEEAATALLADGTAEPGRVASCPVATSLEGLGAAARVLARESVEERSLRVVEGRLPWAECALEVVRSTVPVTVADSFNVNTLEERTGSLVRAPRLARLATLVAAAREVLELAVNLETLSVPFGAGILERYTQVDLVSAYLWNTGMTHEFAAATWYLFSPGAAYDFSAGVSPSAGLDAADRYGVQIGYPVGAPLTAGTDATDFEPDLLIGGIARINGLLSLSAGVVIGREGGERTTPGYASLNLDLSNLGPLQKIFARRDPD
jgi:hypothetical protein